MNDFATWNNDASAGKARRPWVYGITFRMAPPWLDWWARAGEDRASLAVDKDFYLQELAGIYRYNFKIRIGVNGKFLSEKYLPSEFAVPRQGNPAWPLTRVGDRVLFCPAGGVLEVDALPPTKFHWRSNPISIRFIGYVTA